MSVRSLSKLLFAWLMLFILPVIFVSAVVAYYLANQYANLAYDKSLYRKALALADQIEINNTSIKVSLPQVAKELLEFDEEDDVYFRIIGPYGDLIDSNVLLPLPKKFPEKDKHLYYNTTLESDHIRIVAYSFPLEDGNSQFPTKEIYVLVGETTQKRDLMTNEIILGMVVPQLILVLLVSALLFYGIKRGLKPLTKIKSDLNQRDINDLSPLNSQSAPEEVKPLLDAFNDLLVKVKKNVSLQQRFISDASHQLKTPLAGLKTQAELALREKEPEKIQHALHQINQASSNLSHLVNQLLSLTKAEPDGSLFLAKEIIDLQSLAQEVTSEWVNTALKKEIDLEFCNSIASAMIQGNASLIKELMHNLIDNAIRYTHQGGKITVGIKTSEQFVTFFVQDNGIGISQKHQAQIFERFFRVLDSNEEGCGLGLTIVKEIAERHHANIVLTSKGENTGALFEVHFLKALI
ncbi:MAG TPA: sensor histidine kinase [Methylophilaceae bacterium]|nr:sensor histidine kinase [Methylophilaceae bacterium]HAJ72119.1 sensor histidine kinase [Methylophilaceae bacterium]